MKERRFVKFMKKLMRMPETTGARADMFLPDWLMYLGVFLLVCTLGLILLVLADFENTFPMLILIPPALFFGVVSILCWRNQSVRILNDEEFEYTTFLGRKKRYRIDDISRLRQNTDSMTMFVGKKKVHIETAAIKSERFIKMIKPFLPGYENVTESASKECALPCLHLRKGSFVPAVESLREGYKIADGRITANINAENMRSFADGFIAMHDEPMFFILEIPTNAKYIPEGEENVPYKDIYYIDGLSGLSCMNVLDRTWDILIADGLVSFGFGCHNSRDEFVMGKYNILTVFSSEPEKYRRLFQRLNIPENENLVTAPETFTKDSPGKSNIETVDGKTIYDLPQMLEGSGIYLAERRKD